MVGVCSDGDGELSSAGRAERASVDDDDRFEVGTGGGIERVGVDVEVDDVAAHDDFGGGHPACVLVTSRAEPARETVPCLRYLRSVDPGDPGVAREVSDVASAASAWLGTDRR